MKVDRTKYTAHYENGMVVAQWISVEMSLDESAGESPMDALDRSKDIVDKWYKSKNIEPAIYNPHELPVINTAEERIGIEIENATTKEELMKHKDSLSTPYLADLYSTKLIQLQIQSRNK